MFGMSCGWTFEVRMSIFKTFKVTILQFPVYSSRFKLIGLHPAVCSSPNPSLPFMHEVEVSDWYIMAFWEMYIAVATAIVLAWRKTGLLAATYGQSTED